MIHKIGRASRGFTLIEMMLAVGILGLILAMLTSSFSTVSHSKVHAEGHLATDHEGRALLWQMSNEIRGAVQTPSAPSHVMLVGSGGMMGGSAIDSLTISTLDVARHRSFTGFGAEEIVTYSAVPNFQHQGWFLLQRSEQSGLDQTGVPGTTNTTILAGNLLSMHLRYFNGSMWSESWNSASYPEGQQLPIAMTIDLQMAAPNGTMMDFATQVTVPMAMEQW
jgi:prepilin-type N-terminal cleavage/methylation domain-containing protein